MNDKTQKRTTILLFIASVLVPVVRFLFLYNNNATEVPLRGVLLVMGIVAAVFAAGLWLAMLIFRSPLSAFAACAIAWLAIECEEPLTTFLLNKGVTRGAAIIWLLLSAAIIIAAGVFLRRVKKGVEAIALFCTVLLGILLIMNLPALKSSKFSVETKRDFSVTNNDESKPDIYWFHLDGMMNFDTFEKYFGTSQEEFEKELGKRGFQLNRSASIEVCHATGVAIPALTSPYFYDKVLADKLSSRVTAESFRNQLSEHFDLFILACSNKEIFCAFAQTKYNTVVVSPQGIERIYCPIANSSYLYHPSNELQPISVIKESIDNYYKRVVLENGDKAYSTYSNDLALSAFLNRFMLPVGYCLNYWKQNIANNKVRDEYDETSVFDETLDITPQVLQAKLSLVQPQFYSEGYEAKLKTITYAIDEIETNSRPDIAMIVLLDTHSPFMYDENGEAVPEAEKYNVSKYQGTYTYFSRILLSMIDYILACDPDAVIILQGDHGLHTYTTEEFRTAFGEEFENEELQNSVMSAIRIPEQYQTDDMHYALENPLNITRYLVNRFVGEGNYEYIDEAA